MCKKDYQDFGKFNSLSLTLGQINNKEDDDLQLLISPFITATKISCFNSVYSPILFSCWYYDFITETTNQSVQIEN